MELSFAQDPDGTTGTVTDTTTAGTYPAPNTARGDAANYLLFSKTDSAGERTFINPDFGAVLSVMSWAVLTAVSGLYEAILLRIKPYDNGDAYVEEQESGGIITQYPSIVYYPDEDKVYRCIAANTGELPTDDSFWEEVTDLSEIIDNTTIDQEILNINSDKLIDKCIAAKFAGAGCNCSSEDKEYLNNLMAEKRAAEINFASDNFYEYEKIIAQLNDTCGLC
jgi:hypothetical protein